MKAERSVDSVNDQTSTGIVRPVMPQVEWNADVAVGCLCSRNNLFTIMEV